MCVWEGLCACDPRRQERRCSDNLRSSRPGLYVSWLTLSQRRYRGAICKQTAGWGFLWGLFCFSFQGHYLSLLCLTGLRPWVLFPAPPQITLPSKLRWEVTVQGQEGASSHLNLALASKLPEKSFCYNQPLL